MSDEFYMSLAINEAWKYQILTYPNPAVGCVVLDKSGKILSIKAHKKAGFLHAEPSAILFALFELAPEILAKFVREYEAKFGVKFSLSSKAGDTQNSSEFDAKFNKNASDLQAKFNPAEDDIGSNTQKEKLIAALDTALLDAKFSYDFILANHAGLLASAKAYVTLEPCSHTGKTPACATLLKELKFSEVIIGAHDENETASGGAQILKKAGVSVKFGICAKRANELIAPFNAWRSGNFSFFKLALSANGVAAGGIISNEMSRAHMHALRSVCDLLIIGGNTVRTDRPMLDARLAPSGKAPDVLIYSREQNFDPTIPLFSVQNRSVSVSSSLETAFGKALVMIEGGENALRDLDPRVCWILIYRSSEFRDGANLRLNLKLKPLFTGELDDGTFMWYEREI